MLQKIDRALLANDDVLFFNEYFHKVAFISNRREILPKDIDKTILDNNNYFSIDGIIVLYYYSLDSIIHVRLWAWEGNLKNTKNIKQRLRLSKKLMLVA